MMRKSQVNQRILFLIISICALVLLLIVMKHLISSSHKPKNVVEAFYTHEQGGDFAASWELLHPLMKDKWDKTQFMTDRLHVFFGHFGAETFEFTIKEDGEINNWQMAEEVEPFNVAYKFTVIQTFKGKYGKFSFLQEVYVTEDENEWRILWDYN